MKKSTTRCTAIFSIALLCVWVDRAAHGASAASKVERGGRLVTALFSEPKHFNPVKSLDSPTRTVLSLLMGDLMRIDRAEQHVVPNLATSWDISEDGRTFTLTLRENVRFSDGHPMDIEDVLFSFRMYLDDEIHSPQRDLLIVGGEPARFTRLDAHRLQLHLAQPYAAGERLFDGLYILPSHILRDDYENGRIDDAWGLQTEPQRIVGLGPFRLKNVVAGERIVLERNPFYWKVDASGGPLPYLDEVVFTIAPSEETALLRFKAGELDVIERLSARDFDQLQNDTASYRLLDLGPGLEYNFLFFNLNPSDEAVNSALATKQAWFRQSEFRRAISAAIDREAIVELVYGGRAAAITSHVSPGNKAWIHENLSSPVTSLQEARSRLRKLGFRWDDDDRLIDESQQNVAFSILVNAGNEKRAMMASLIQEDLSKLGVGVTIATLEFRSYIDRIFESRDYEACLLGLVSGDADPNPEMSLLMSSGAMHLWHPEQASPATTWEAELDQLMEEQLTTLAPKRRKRLYDRVQEIIVEHRPIIALASPNILVGATTRLRNFRPGVLPPYTLWNADELYLTTSRPP